MTAPRTLSRLGWLPLFVAASSQPAPAASVCGADLERPPLVSPGSSDRVVPIDRACPTFSWGRVEGASGYELVVHDASDAEGEVPVVLRKTLPGGATSWTPAMGECLENGGTYAWMIWASGAQGGSWSEPAMFEVAVADSSAGTVLAQARRLAERLAALEQELDGLAATSAAVSPTGVSSVMSLSHLEAGDVGGDKIDTIRAATVECNGECTDGTLDDLCEQMFSGEPIAAFSPHSVPDPGRPTSTCGGDNDCAGAGFGGWTCKDGSGWDCLVFCMQ